MPLINDIPQLNSVYIFSSIKSQHEESATKRQKISSVYTNIDDLCKVLQQGIKKCNQDSIAMSFVTANEMASTNDLNQLEPTFMYTQIFKDILLHMEYDKQAIIQFTTYCRQHDCGSAKNIHKFENEYYTKSAIWWYTCPLFIYSMLNYGLRSMEGDTIINMGFFIQDLHQQIQQLHQQQVHSYHGKPFIVYRGQGLSKANFEKLQRTKRGLISFNNFLSTSTEQHIALGLAISASHSTDMVGILFIMSIDPCIKSPPFASIKDMSYFEEEEEILFSMHTVFRVGRIEQMENNTELYQVELQLTSDDDEQLRLLTDRIREEVDGTGWRKLGDLLIKIGQINKAEELYNILLKQTSNKGEKPYYFNQLGTVKDAQGDYEKAIWYYDKVLKILQKRLPSNDPNFATLYNNIGSVYSKMEEHSKAMSFYEKVLEIYQKTLPSNHPDLATSYDNIAVMYSNMGDYSKALSYSERAQDILQRTLPAIDPHLATSYNNIASVYDNMGEYSKALLFYEKALEIQQKTLPSNHPNLATSYNNIGCVYDNMIDYSKSLSYIKRALNIWQRALPPTHPHLATPYNNIAGVYNKIREYPKALSFHEKALEIRQKTFHSNHPDLATSYNNIATVYFNMKEYSKALSSYEKALEIREITFPSNHPDIKTVKESIEMLKRNYKEHFINK
ncbi:unnamed protein product [Adineta steineri]|uniref:Multifunctional fusion protein n=1 Tax=Adineta steineri TaxID=433720 RepID=A0A819CT29_9BILA|nr:unnamed protein product [Adineta steineri]CAF3820955.1 unnamed protein product [Adineta steineri]